MRLGIAIAVGLALVTAIVIVVNRMEPSDERTSNDTATDESERPTLRGSEPADGEEAPPAKAAEAPKPIDEPEVPRTRVTGTLMEIRPDGKPVPVAKGEVTLGHWKDGADGELTVEVIDGKWSADIPTGHRLMPQALKINGRLAVLDDDSEDPRPVGDELGSVDLRAEVVKPTTLRVIDAETKRDLTGVTVVWPAEGMDEDLTHPGRIHPDGVITRDGASPMNVPVWDPEWVMREAVLWAWCDRYAWGRLVFDQVTGGERVLQLRRGGGLDVLLTGATATDEMWLRVREVKEDAKEYVPFTELEVSGATVFKFDGLPEGRYEGAVEIGDWWATPFPVATGAFEIVAGRRTELALELVKATPPDPVPVAGTIVIPKSWELKEPTLSVTMRNVGLAKETEYKWLYAGRQLKRVEGSDDTWQFDLGKLLPCTAIFKVQPTGYRMVWPIGPDGDRDIRIDVPPPGNVSIRVIDARTGKDADIERIAWHAISPADRWGWTWETARRDEATGRFEFRAPLGRIGFDVEGMTLPNFEETIEVIAAGVEKTVTIEPAGSVLVVLLDGDARIPHPAYVEMYKDGEDRSFAWGGNDEGCEVWVEEPGRYRLHVPDLEGYEPVPDREVEIETGKQTKVTIKLERKP